MTPARSTAAAVAVAIAAIVLAAAIEFAAAAHVRPSFDAFGWLVWGRETVHGHLDTSAAPSWKPLTYLFTLPFALFGRTQLSLWCVTATGAAILGWVFAARLAFRLARDAVAAPTWWSDGPALLAGLAGLGVVPLMYGMWHQVLIADSDPMVVTLCLAAVDTGLSDRRRTTLALLVLATLGRPEALPFAVLYGAWMVAMRREQWPAALLAFVAIPVGLFLVPALTARSWFIAGDLATGFRTAITHGSRIGTVFYRFGSLYPPAVWIAAPVGVIVATAVRSVRWLVLAGAVLLWVLVEVAFAYHGWPAAPRYLMEPGAVTGVLGAAALGRGLRFAVSSAPGWRDRSGSGSGVFGWTGRLAALAGVVVLAVTLVPAGRARAGALRHDVVHQREVAARIASLPRAIAAAGGAEAITRCAPPLSFVGNQSMLAWYLTLNVGAVAYKWKLYIHHNLPAVFITPHGSRWRIRAINIPPAGRERCRGVPIETRGSARQPLTAGRIPHHSRHIRVPHRGPRHARHVRRGPHRDRRSRGRVST